MRSLSLLAGFLVACSEVVVPPAGGADPGEAPPVGGAGSGGGGGSTLATGAGGTGGAPGCVAPWSHILGGEGSNWVRNHAVGPDGSVAVTVNSTSELTLDGAPLGLADGGFALLAFDANGELRWARRFGQSSQGGTLPVAIDALGNIVVGGIGYGPIDLGSGVSADQPFAHGYVAQYAPDGEPLWIRSWGVPIESGGLYNMVLDPAGNVVFQGAIGYDPYVVEIAGLAATGHTFLGKLGPDGSPLWVRGFTGEHLELNGLAVTAEGRIVTGESLELEGHFGPLSLSTPGDFDVLSLEIEWDGTVLDARQFGDDDLQRARAFAIGPLGHRLLVLTNWGEVDFGAGPVGGGPSDEVVFAAFDADGALLFSKSAPETYAPLAIAPLDDGGFVLATSASLVSALGCEGEATEGIVLAKLSMSGACTVVAPLARCVGEAECDVGPSSVSRRGPVTISTGAFYGSVEVGAGVVTAEAWDSFVASSGDCGVK